MKLRKYWGMLVIPLMAGLWFVIMSLFEISGITKNRNTQDTLITEIKSLIRLNDSIIQLPSPKHTGDYSIEEALFNRRSIRSFSKDSITVKNISQILWAAYGITDTSKLTGIDLKTAPSAGALFPLTVYVVVNNAEKIEQGIYKYQPKRHTISLIRKGNFKEALFEATYKESMILEAAACIIITADFEATIAKYGERGENYVYMEAGHAAQNIYLQCTALNLGTCAIGAFNDDKVKEIITLNEKEKPIYILPFGKKK